MRSLLFAPGVSAKMMAKAIGGPADMVVLDLEDSVPPDAEESARANVAAALLALRRQQGGLYVRVNPLDGAWCEDDLAAVLPARVASFMSSIIRLRNGVIDCSCVVEVAPIRLDANDTLSKKHAKPCRKSPTA